VLIVQMQAWKQVPSPIWRPLLALGTVSYAAYLWKYPIALWLGVTVGEPFSAPLSIALTIVAATVSWFVVERAVLRWKESLDRRAVPAAANVTEAA
jgi:peptidoglycan/LPS O-acetylase OafA/YrhL